MVKRLGVTTSSLPFCATPSEMQMPSRLRKSVAGVLLSYHCYSMRNGREGKWNNNLMVFALRR